MFRKYSRLGILGMMIMAILFFDLAIVDVGAIPTRDKQAITEELNAYGIDVLDHYPDQEPTTADDYYKLGVAYLSRNMPQAAIEQFQRALELDPGHEGSVLGLSGSTAQLGDVDAAMAHTEKALKTKPDSPRLHNMIGAIRMANATDLKHLNEAAAKFKKAISLDPKLVPPHMNLARLHMSMRKPQAAVQEYKSVIAIQPENLVAHAELARAYLATGSLDKATEEAERTVELAPQNPVSHNILGEMYARKGQLDRALSIFQKSVEIAPTYAPGYKNTGHIHLMTGSVDKAIEEYRKALSYRPNYGEAYSGLGDAYLSKGMIPEATKEYKNAVELLPVSAVVSVPAYNNLAYIYAEREGDLDEALSLAQKAKQLAPEHPGIADTIGWIYYKKGLYDEAVTNLEIAVKGLPDNPIIRYHLGAAYLKQGVRDKAALELERALDLDSSFEGAEDARLMMAELER